MRRGSKEEMRGRANEKRRGEEGRWKEGLEMERGRGEGEGEGD